MSVRREGRGCMMGREGRFTTSPASFTRSYFLPVKITKSQTVVGRSQMSRRFVNQQTHNIQGIETLNTIWSA